MSNQPGDRHIDLRDPDTTSGTHHTQVIDTRAEYADAPYEYEAPTPSSGMGSTALDDYSQQSWDESDERDFYDEPPVTPRGFGGPFGAFLALLTSGAVAAALASGPSLPARADSRGWAILLTALDVDGPRTIATWWGVVIMTLTAVWAWAAAGRARQGRRWLRWSAWGLLGLVVLAMSASHLLSLHTQVAQLDSIKRLGVPALVAQHPVEVVIAAALALPSLILLIGSSSAQRALLVLGAVMYLVGTLVLGGGRWVVSDNGQYQHVAEAVFEWIGMALVMLSAGLERVRPRRRQ